MAMVDSSMKCTRGDSFRLIVLLFLVQGKGGWNFQGTNAERASWRGAGEDNFPLPTLNFSLTENFRS